MADTKITALTALTGADPANDVIPIVDVSDTTMAASGTTKKISVNNILGASGTATLASATITGNLTVQGNGPHRFGTTNYSQFDQSSLQFVGSRSTPGTLCIYGNANRLIFQADTGGYLFQNSANTLTLISISDNATQLTLNSTGLGVGGSPTAKLTIFAGADGDVGFFRGGSTRQVQIGTSATAGYLNSDNGSAGFELRVNGTARAYFDTSGNVGIGVTPSAWSSSYKAIQIGTVGSLSSGSSSTFGAIFASNMYQAAGGATYIANGYASRYDVRTDNGNHVWYISSNNTLGANQPLSFNTAMTLESTGSLVLGNAAVATTATDGFLYIPSCAGAPTGVPTAKTGRVPMVVDSTNNRFYVYVSGAWKFAALV